MYSEQSPIGDKTLYQTISLPHNVGCEKTQYRTQYLTTLIGRSLKVLNEMYIYFLLILQYYYM